MVVEVEESPQVAGTAAAGADGETTGSDTERQRRLGGWHQKIARRDMR